MPDAQPGPKTDRQTGHDTTDAPWPECRFSVQAQFWLVAGDESLAGPGRIDLLRLIDELGSIRQAALRMGMGYRAAWDAVDAMNRRVGCELVTKATGGRSGGGARLTGCGQRLVAAYAALEAEHQLHLQTMSTRLRTLMAEG